MNNEILGAMDEVEPLRARLSRQLREGLVERAVSLPLGSQAALLQVSSLCQHRGSSIARIATAAAGDAGFAATLLRLSNSAASASRVEISDLPTAITRLGTRMVGMLAIAAPTLRLLNSPDDTFAEVRRELHRHAIRVGVVARELVPPSVQPETALAAGLVHNIGLGVLSLYAPVGLGRVLESSWPDKRLTASEREQFGFTHGELGGMLAREWQFPWFLVEAVEEHDTERPETPLTAVVQVADLLVREHGIGVEPPLPIPAQVAQMASVIVDTARPKIARLLDPEATDDGSEGDSSALRLLRAFDGLDVAA
jgi:HD-like signal output (HDOD) protein